MCRAAEVGSIECAKILLEYNADIDALNFTGQTPFHVVGPNLCGDNYRPLRNKTLPLGNIWSQIEQGKTAEAAASNADYLSSKSTRTREAQGNSRNWRGSKN